MSAFGGKADMPIGRDAGSEKTRDETNGPIDTLMK
jgi:hypothetical protein